MVKHVKAPKTYDPGKGRPLEHLAYLNTREMDYLRRINGNNMERGPKNLPSFPPDDSLGSSSKASSKSSTSSKSSATGGGNKGSAGRSSGPGGPSGPNSGPSRSSGGTSTTSKTTSSGFRGAGGNFGPGSARPGTSSSFSKGAGPSSPMRGQGGSFSSPSAAASRNRDVSLKNSLAGRDAINTVKNTPAVKNDGVTGFRAQALGAKPIGSINSPKKTYSSSASVPVQRDIEITRNLDKIKESFYKNDPDYQKALKEQTNKVARARESVGLLGTGISPRSPLSAPARTAPSTKMTPGEWQGLADKYNPVKAAGRLASGIGSLASTVYNDPAGSIKGALEGFGRYSKDTLDTIGAAATSSDPDVQRAAAEKAAEVGLNYGLLGSAGSMVGGVPKNSLGAFVSPSVTSSPSIRKAGEWAKDMFDRYSYKGMPADELTNLKADVFNKTKKMVGSDVGGIQRIKGNLGVEIAGAYEPKVTDIKGVAKYGDVFVDDAVTRNVPQIKGLNVVSNPKQIRDELLGYYSPEATFDTYRGVAGAYRELRDMLTKNTPGPSIVERKPSIAINSFDPKVLGTKEIGATPQKIAAHEAGVHYMSDLSGGLFGQGSPVNPKIYEGKLLEQRPNFSRTTAEDLSIKAYFDHIEEQIARRMEDERRRSGSFIRDFDNRITNLSEQELEDAFRSFEFRKMLGMK